MSALPTYVLVCDGDGCTERFVLASPAVARLRDLRPIAAKRGWAYRLEPLPNGTVTPSRDYCPKHAGGKP